MRIAVTGGAGFVGIHVVKELHRRSLGDVFVLDNGRNSTPVHLAELSSIANLLKIDLLHDELNACFASLRPDVLIHLAGLHQAAYCESRRAETIRINVEAVERLLEAAISSGVKRIFVASSSAAYAPLDRPYKETDRLAPPDLYGLTKLINEEQVRLWSAKSPSTRFAVGRLFNVVGGFETSPRLIPEVVRRALQGSRIAIGNTKPRRDYIHVKDVARAIISMTLENPDSLDICNIGSGTHWSVEDVIGLVGELLGRRILFERCPELIRKNERMLIAAEIERIRQRYKWRPQYSLETALHDAINFADILS